MRGQSNAARADRLRDGRCPTHGLGMGQVAGWYQPTDGSPAYTIEGCPRSSCDVRARAESIDGPHTLLPPGWRPTDPRADW
jgi:hypothetical protein